jgi:hypothetical protein
MTHQPCPPIAVLWEPEIERLYKRLREDDPFKIAIRKGRDILSRDRYAAQYRVPKDRIPPYYIRKNGVKNLYVLRIDKVRRLSYTIIEDKVGVKEVFPDHASYDRRFGY